MDTTIFAGLLASLPAVSFWVSWPRRAWASWIVAGIILALWVGGFAFVGAEETARLSWIGVGAWGLFGGLYASYVVGRNASDYAGLETLLKERKDKKDSLQKSVGGAKSHGSVTESEQKEVMALYGMVKGLSEALNWDEIRPKLETAVQQYLGFEEFAVYVSEMRAQNTFHPLVTRRLGSSVGASWDTLERYLQERKLPVSTAHLMETPERAVLAPVRESQEMMGYFFARLPPGADGQTALRKASGFADEIAFAFRRLKLFQEVERLSQIDGLTGVYRRGVLDQRLKEEVVRARTFKTTFCLMLMDIDHFKKLNDTYGHPFGDQVLRRVGELLKQSVYETDFVARYGGEEFAILLPRADAAGVLRKAEAVRQAIEKEVYQLALETIRVTMSIGIAHFPRDGNSPEDVIHQADQALYSAKETGRNRAVDIAEVKKK